MALDDIIQDRLKKVDALRSKGIDPYPSRSEKTLSVGELLENFEERSPEEEFTIAGRVMSVREHGGSVFVDVDDGTGRIQGYLKKDALGAEQFDLFGEVVDMGDFVDLSGTPTVTKRGEKSVLATRWRMLAKTLRPLPEKWHGLKDTELRFRQRYLDILMNEEVRNRFVLRTKIITSIRRFLDARGFLEIETPTLQPVYGGGFARPFVTHHNALDKDFYLRISDEMYLKRLIVGGFPKVYEITKVFRNEGIDHDHNPEFTMFEAQVAYEDYRYGMDLTEEMFERVALETLGTTKLSFDGAEIDVKRPWKRLRVIESIEEHAGIEPLEWKAVDDALVALEKAGLSSVKLAEAKKLRSVGELIGFAFEELVEEKLIQPTIIYDYPVETSPLAKRSKNPRFTERFEIFAFGSELGNNYSELNDPLDLRERFVEEKKKKEAGFEEAHQTDEEYAAAIEHGFPPTCGLGIGVDRMVMLFADAKNIKEIIPFPTLRPKED